DEGNCKDGREKEGQHRNGNDWNHELWKVHGLFVPEPIECIQVLIVVAYCETKMLLVLLSDRLLDPTGRSRGRGDSRRCCRGACDWRSGGCLRKRACRQREGTKGDNDESVHNGLFDRKMRATPRLDSTISSLPRQLKGCALRMTGHYLSPSPAFAKVAAGRQNCGCSSVVERLVANEKVASSTLVTRSI